MKTPTSGTGFFGEDAFNLRGWLVKHQKIEVYNERVTLLTLKTF